MPGVAVRPGAGSVGFPLVGVAGRGVCNEDVGSMVVSGAGVGTTGVAPGTGSRVILSPAPRDSFLPSVVRSSFPAVTKIVVLPVAATLTEYCPGMTVVQCAAGVVISMLAFSVGHMLTKPESVAIVIFQVSPDFSKLFKYKALFSPICSRDPSGKRRMAGEFSPARTTEPGTTFCPGLIFSHVPFGFSICAEPPASTAA